jgi:glutamine cyclotransferase
MVRSSDLPQQFYGEGMTILGEKIFQLTWKSNVGFVYDLDTFEPIGAFAYPTEGWGITHDGHNLIMSDGTASLHFLDPETFEKVGQVIVHDGAEPVVRLNELEYIQGQIYANIWMKDRIAVIDPHTGSVTAWLDLGGLMLQGDSGEALPYLNGIAYDAENDRLFVTGKLWPRLFEIKLVVPD